MMKQALALTVLCCCAVLTAAAQSTGTITGSVNNTEGKPVASATVSLLRARDSSLAKLAVTNQSGQFEFINIKEGKYLASVSYVGHDKAYSAVFEVAGNQTIALPAFVLKEAIKGLANVTVQSTRPFVETKLDKTVVNVEASPTNAGATALEVLEKSPGVTVNNDGAISLRGKAGVIVLVDGKQTFLSPSDLANMLRNMPASALDQIEIMTNPSAKYDAAGNSGIINIKTKKGKNDGFNGSIMAGPAVAIYRIKGTTYLLQRWQNSFNFNYRKGKLNYFGNYNPNAFQGRNLLTLERKFIEDGVFKGTADQEALFKFRGNNHTLKLGVDWYANKKNVFGMVFNGFLFNGFPTPTTVSNIRNENGQLQSRMVSYTDNDLSFGNLSGNLNWKHNFDTAGTELTLDLDYVHYRNTSDMLLTTDFFDDNGGNGVPPLLLRGHLPALINIYTLKSDFTRPIKGGRIEAGVKSSYVSNDNLVDYQRFADNKWVTDARSNHFVYDENINAVYANINRQVKKWNFQGGLRLENTIAKGYQVTNDSTFRRNFTNLFPSAFASYELDKNNKLSVSYSRRITRPNYQDLNPFTYFLDSITYRKGNPYLLPQFTNNFELSYSYKGKFIATANWNNTNDVISQILRQNNEDKITFLTAENVSEFRNIGLSLTLPLPVAKWWNLNFFTNIYNNRYQGVYDNIPVDLSYTSFMANLTNTFTLKKGFTAELSGFYRHRGVDQLAIMEPIYQMSFGLQKQVLKEKGTLRFNVRDPFAWQQFEGKNRYANIDSRFLARPAIRQVALTFTYRFGKNTPQAQPRRRSSSSQEEQNRVGGQQGGN